MGKAIMLSGPIGAGKTTVARDLIALLPQPLAYIEGDTFWSFITRSGQRNRRENFLVIMRSMTAAALPFAREGFDVLLDFSFPPDFLDTAQKILKEVPLDFIVLKPSQEVCESRASARAEGKISDYGPYRSFYSLFAGAERFTIQDDAADSRSLAARIRDGLSAGTFRVGGSD